MKILLAGSMAFAKQMVEVRRELEERGHVVSVTDDLDKYAEDDSIKLDFEAELKLALESDIMMSFFKKIPENDALLVLNYEKRGVSGYLGTSVLMEMGLAYYLGKKIYLLNSIDKSQGSALEVAIINPVILNGELEDII